MTLKTIQWLDNAVLIVDQTLLPSELVYERIETVESMWDAIRRLKVRGAPAIGIAAAFGLYLGVRSLPDGLDGASFFSALLEKSAYLASSRPTAVNLFWALNRLKAMASALTAAGMPVARIKARLLEEAVAILEEDRRMCRSIGEHGFALLDGKKTILTHCNAGGLATSEYGTALAPVYLALERGQVMHVFADETRPLLQGARVTAFELSRAGIPVTLICDNMAAVVMAQKKIDAVIVGADRIAANGDTANKIGTYGLAISAHAHGVPFYVAAPVSTFDLSLASGEEIPIEEREAGEITCGFGRRTAPIGIEVYNPAFDVTPFRYITSFITDRGVIDPPFLEKLPSLLAPAGSV
jgi:methylthioribose-1-phosphate isomerase